VGVLDGVVVDLVVEREGADFGGEFEASHCNDNGDFVVELCESDALFPNYFGIVTLYITRTANFRVKNLLKLVECSLIDVERNTSKLHQINFSVHVTRFCSGSVAVCYVFPFR